MNVTIKSHGYQGQPGSAVSSCHSMSLIGVVQANC